MSRKVLGKETTTNKEFKVYITDRAVLFTEKDLEKYEIPQSKQIEKLQFGTEIIEPPYNLETLMMWTEVSVSHAACIKTKVQDAVGIGWTLKSKEGIEQTDATIAEKKILDTFLNKVNETEDITTVLKKVDFDYEGNGNGYLEIARGLDAKVSAIYHVPSQTIRLHKSKEKYVQEVSGKSVWFKKYGDQRVLNKITGEFGPVTVPTLAANELISVKQYTWRSAYYGAPDWLPAVMPMFGEQKEKEYNMQFFQNFGIPAYAVIMEGGNYNVEVEETIKKYFDTELKQQNHKTMVLTAPAGGTIKFERLNVEQKEASFRVFKKDNRDDVLTAHRVPPYRAGIVISGQLGGSVAADTDRIYLTSVIDPKQKQYEWVINNLIIKDGFQITAWQFILNDILIDERKSKAEIDTLYFAIGSKTSNEIRVENGLSPYDGGDNFYVAGIRVGENQDEEGNSTLSLSEKRLTDDQRKLNEIKRVFQREINQEFKRQLRETMEYLESQRDTIEADIARRASQETAEKSIDFYEPVIAKISRDEMEFIDAVTDGWAKKVMPEKMIPIITKHTTKAANHGGQLSMKEIFGKKAGIGLGFDLNDPNILDKIKTRAKEITGKIAEKTRQDIRNSMAKNLYEDKGKGWKALEKDIKKHIPETYKNRSEVIANTETAIAQEETRLESFKRNTGEGTKKKWIAQKDNLTRDTHREVDGTKIPLEENFIVGEAEMNGPHDPSGPPEEVINCRCDLEIHPAKVPSVEEAWTGD